MVSSGVCQEINHGILVSCGVLSGTKASFHEEVARQDEKVFQEVYFIYYFQQSVNVMFIMFALGLPNVNTFPCFMFS